jgi:hypothetical protein
MHYHRNSVFHDPDLPHLISPPIRRKFIKNFLVLIYLLLFLRFLGVPGCTVNSQNFSPSPEKNQTQHHGVSMKGFLGSFGDWISNVLSGKELEGTAWCEKYNDSHKSSGGILDIAVDPRRAFKDPCVIALSIAAQRGDLKGIEKALSAGADVNKVADQSTGQNITPIFFALIPDATPALERLIAAGARPNVFMFQNKYSPMLIAVSKKDPRFTELLLKAGADANQETPFGGPGSMLGRAIILGNEPAARLLIKHGADVKGTYERQPLLLNSIEWEKLGYVPMLLKAGALWTDAETNAFCWYNANKAARLDRKHPVWANLQATWDALEERGIKVPCERIRK